MARDLINNFRHLIGRREVGELTKRVFLIDKQGKCISKR